MKKTVTEMQFAASQILVETPAHFCRASPTVVSNMREDCREVCCCVHVRLNSTMTALYHTQQTSKYPVTHTAQSPQCCTLHFRLLTADLMCHNSAQMLTIIGPGRNWDDAQKGQGNTYSSHGYGELSKLRVYRLVYIISTFITRLLWQPKQSRAFL